MTASNALNVPSGIGWNALPLKERNKNDVPFCLKEIPGFNGYLSSPSGNIVSLRTKKTLLPVKDRYGYNRVRVKDDFGQMKTKSVHSLVAACFLSGPKNETINHIDGDKSNNLFSNLEWISNRENIIHARRMKKRKLPLGVFEQNGRYRAYICVNRKRINLGKFDTPELASDAYREAVKTYVKSWSHFRAATLTPWLFVF